MISLVRQQDDHTLALVLSPRIMRLTPRLHEVARVPVAARRLLQYFGPVTQLANNNEKRFRAKVRTQHSRNARSSQVGCGLIPYRATTLANQLIAAR
jgi:hypothetical protein